MTWHLDQGTVDAYTAGRVSDAVAASLEAHVVACAQCRSRMTNIAGPRLAQNLAAVLDVIDTPRVHPVERVLVRLGLREHIARLLVVTPAMRLAWIASVLVVCLLAFIAGDTSSGEFVFLVLAPIVPVAGIAISFGPPMDPAHEMLLAAPVGALELLLVRAAAVLATSVPITAVVGLVIPGDPWAAAAWLLPALGLTGATLALARWLPLRMAAGGLSGAWLLAALAATRSTRAAQLVEDFPAFRPSGQLAFLALALVAAASVVATRDSFDLRRAS